MLVLNHKYSRFICGGKRYPMKKAVSLLFVLVLLVTLCGCGKKPEALRIEYGGEKVKQLEFDIDAEYGEDELTLTAVVEPEDAEATVTWESYDEDIVGITDNGDGTCTLSLEAPGETKIIAGCGGDISDIISVTVNEVKLLYDWDALGEPPVYGTVDNEFTVETKANRAKVVFTGNEVKDSGALETDAVYREVFMPHFEQINTGSADGAYLFSDRFFHYELQDSLFTFFATKYNDMTVAYTPVYENGGMTGIIADFGEDNVTEINFLCDEDKNVSVSFSGYGGDKVLDKQETDVGVLEEDGGICVAIQKKDIQIKLGAIGPTEDNHKIAYLFAKLLDDGKSFGVYKLWVYDSERDAAYMIESKSDDGKFTDLSYSIQTKVIINGYDCQLDFKQDEIYFNVWVISNNSYQSVSYYYDYDYNFDTGNAWIVKNGSFDYVLLTADGNKIKA